MAALNKLAIRGIRSFDDKHVQVIEFYSPLTVIVGHNGSGKTTIIECLKYATTGDLPPNTKGGAFVHDPKMANEKEVKAQVRLRFWNVKRQRMTATRSLQVTTKKTGALSMKTLEGLLAKTDVDGGDSKRNVISTKCAEMDEEVPMLLGVSKAILENVIFCHQEDSNWPLSEPAALKKKFDDIFEATKYTKALDNIKALRKERTQELKVDKERLKFLKADKDKAERMRKDLADTIDKENKKATEVEKLKDEYERLRDNNHQFRQQATNFNTIFERVESLKQRKEMFERNRERLQGTMTVLNGTTEELQAMYQNFETHLKSVEAKRDKQIELQEKEDEAIEDLRRREKNLATTQGGLIANREAYNRNVKAREEAVREAARAHDYQGYDYSPLEESKIVEFMDKLQELIRKAEADLKRIQVDGRRKERELEAELERLSAARTTAVANKATKQDQITSLTSRIRGMEASFDSVSSVDADISVMENDIAVTSGRRDRLEEEIQAARYDEQIREHNASLRQKDLDKEKLDAELHALSSQASSRAELAMKRSELETKTGSMQASMQTHSARFKELVGSDIDPETMEEKVTTTAGRKERELQDAETTASSKNHTLSQLQTSLRIAKQSLTSKNDQLAKLDQKIAEVLEENGAASLDAAIEEAENEQNFRQMELANADTLVQFYQQVLEKGATKKTCLGCDRAIHADEKQGFEVYVHARIERLAKKNTREAKEELKVWEDELKRLRDLQPSAATAKSLNEREIPALEKQISEDSVKLQKAQEEEESAKENVQKAKLATRDIGNLKSHAAMISRTAGEIKDLQLAIQRLERDLQSSGSLKTADDVRRERDQVSAEAKNIQRERDQVSSDKELKVTTMRTLSDDLSRKSVKLGQLKGKQERRKLDEAALREAQDQLVALQSDLRTLEQTLQSANAPFNEKKNALNTAKAERENAEDDANTQLGILHASYSELENRHRACQTYITEGNERKIRENTAHLDDIKREITATQQARAAIAATVTKLHDDVARAGHTKSNIKSNLDYRTEGRTIDEVQAELDEIDIEQAYKARREFNTQANQKEEAETRAQNQWQMASGVLMQMTENRKTAEQTLKADYKDVDGQFREQLIKTRTSEVANSDLEKYGKALDNAILRYHAIKMDEINDSINHLWSKTYQGTDIDGIRIVSDHDEASTSARKSYNYRVVMVKNTVELDMRGRCSAGQKVLASIIIRLALAESFGQGCGVLALDEPTTNLDQENINALAEALAEIIRERRRQTNFQLIVITHDEGFLQRLAAHDVLEYYWRVSRDASQKSTLERQRVGI